MYDYSSFGCDDFFFVGTNFLSLSNIAFLDALNGEG